MEEPSACTSDATCCWRCWLRRMVLQLPEGCAGVWWQPHGGCGHCNSWRVWYRQCTGTRADQLPHWYWAAALWLFS